MAARALAHVVMRAVGLVLVITYVTIGFVAFHFVFVFYGGRGGAVEA